ncbi:hypothetical protein [Streptomyces sp. Tue6028]|uniref:hypothetical protein n=1 Tax=Streptomyces sp. Tue6028 TaxID=2036037 RepID=UPI003EB6A700
MEQACQAAGAHTRPACQGGKGLWDGWVLGDRVQDPAQHPVSRRGVWVRTLNCDWPPGRCVNTTMSLAGAGDIGAEVLFD